MSRLSDAIGPYTTTPNSIVKLMPEMGIEAFALWSYLRFRTNGESGLAFPAYETIKKDTGLHPRKIAAAIRKLESLNLLDRHKRFGKSTEYILKAPSPSTIGTTDPSTTGRTVLPMVAQQSFHHWKTNKTDINKIDSNKTDSTNRPPAQESIQEEQARIRGIVSEPLKAIIGDIEEAMGQLKPAKLRWIADLWEEFPFLDGHLHAFNATKRKEFFNPAYYETCLVQWRAKHPDAKPSEKGGNHHVKPNGSLERERTRTRERRT